MLQDKNCQFLCRALSFGHQSVSGYRRQWTVLNLQDRKRRESGKRADFKCVVFPTEKAFVKSVSDHRILVKKLIRLIQFILIAPNHNKKLKH